MDHFCPACRGGGSITIPLYYLLGAVETFEVQAQELKPASMKINCPLCGPKDIPFDRLSMLVERRDLRPEMPEGLQDHIRKTACRAFADKLESFIQMDERPTPLGTAIRCRLWVVAPQHVATLEERIAERQFDVSAEVVVEAEAQVKNWGSYYHRQNVDKWQAIEWMQTALRNIRGKYAKRT